MTSSNSISEKHLEIAELFLDGNADLRHALGLDSSALLEARPLGSGEHNINFSLWAEGRDLRRVLRINLGTQTGNERQVSYEATALELLEPSGRVPHVFYIDDTKRHISHGAMVVEYRDGSWLDYGSAAAMEEAARILADVHAVTPARDCPIKRADDPLQAYFNVCQTFYRNYLASPYADPVVTGYVEEFFAHANRALETPHDMRDDAHILNTEPLASQFLIPSSAKGCVGGDAASVGVGLGGAAGSKETGGAVMGGVEPGDIAGGAASACGAAASGGVSAGDGRETESDGRAGGSLIDWEKPVVGEVAQDIAYFLSPTSTIWDTDYVLNANEREKFIGDYWHAVDGRFPQGRFEERLAAYVKMTCLLAITWSCNAVVEYNDPARELKTERTRRLLPIYLSEEYLANLLDNWFNVALE